MPRVIIITTSGDFMKAVATLNRIRRRLPVMTRKGMMRWGKILERDMKSSTKRAGIDSFTGTLQTTGIRYEQRPRGNIGKLFIRQYGVFLDSMAPHFVNVTRRRTRLLLWARVARSDSIRGRARLLEQRAIQKFTLYVRPKPFIREGYRRARPKLGTIIRREVARAIQTA